jgi:3-carboxy-cis,cis-muconate cycloisomerase
MSRIFSPEGHVRSLLAFEAGLARVQAGLGIIPEVAAETIRAKCDEKLFDVAALFAEASLSGTPVIPLVTRLTELVGGDSQKYVHWAATSQDALDTALMLQIRGGLSLLSEGLDAVCRRCAALAEQHRQTVMAGRTLLQHAVPITFGLKAARWLAMARRRSQSLGALQARATAVQLGGAAGTLAAIAPGEGSDRGLLLVEALAEELALPAPDLPWHAERDRVAEIAAHLGVVAGAMAKIAGDIVLLAQTEVAEVLEAGKPGKGASSAMPQKRNPVHAIRALTAARLAIGEVPVILSAMAAGHERGAGDWQAEWAAVPHLFRYTACSVEAVRISLEELVVNPKRMAENLERTGGQIMAEALTMALASHVGRPAAQRTVAEICRQAEASGKTVKEIASSDPRIADHLDTERLDRALDPASYLGSADALIERSLEAFRKSPTRGAGR